MAVAAVAVPGGCTDIRLNTGGYPLDSAGGRDRGRYCQGNVQACAFLKFRIRMIAIGSTNIGTQEPLLRL